LLKVMLVDDEEWCLEELAEILTSSGLAEITGAYSYATEAMDAAIRDDPDVVFIDVQMPGMNGLELARRLKQDLCEVCVVLMSEKECFARDGFDIGVDDYVLKPLRKERVLKALERAV
jgi:two-component system, LytTR family, response regulator